MTHQERTEKASREGGMRSGDRSMRGALWAIAHSVAAAADALEAGDAQRLDEINRGLQEFTDRMENPDKYAVEEFTVPYRGVLHVIPAPPPDTMTQPPTQPPIGTWSIGVAVGPGRYRITEITDERPEGETS